MTILEWMTRRKKSLLAVGAVLAALLLALYFRALFHPGYWYDGIFLARQQAGVFSGQDYRAACTLQMERRESEAALSFTLNGETRNYRILLGSDGFSTQIYEDGTLTFTGQAHSMGDWYMLTDTTGDFDMDDIAQIHVGPQEPPPEFPSRNQLYTWAVSDRCDTFGTPMFLLPLLLLAACLAVDIRFPNFFFLMRHGLEVDGGEPSDWYRAGQKFGRVVLVLAMLYCVGASLFMH